MSFNVFLPDNIVSLADSIVYDEDTKEVLVSFDRFTMSFTTEEFTYFSSEVIEAVETFKGLLIKKVQERSNQEIN